MAKTTTKTKKKEEVDVQEVNATEGMEQGNEQAADERSQKTETREAEVVEEKSVSVHKPGGALAEPLKPDPRILQRVAEVKESLESFDDMRLPIIRLKKEGLELIEGEEPVNAFQGVIVFTKQSNTYYKKKFKAGEVTQPDCSSADGKFPDHTIEKPVSKSCDICPMNKFGSAGDGDGKACKNTRPTFILVYSNESGEVPLIPRVLRVSPTSLKLIRNYITSVAADYGSYYGVMTNFSLYKEKGDDQAYFNIKFRTARRLTDQEKADVSFIRKEWLSYMQKGSFGLDDIDVTPAKEDDTPPVNPEEAEVEF